MRAQQPFRGAASLRARLSTASDHLDESSWLPPQWAEAPRVRLGGRLVNVLWILPIVLVVLVLGIAVCRPFYDSQWFQQFLAQYPGTPAQAEVHSGFPLWLRVLHVLNLFFMAFIIRSGIQILADHPRLYWQRDCTPGTDWFRFQHAVPTDRVWTSRDDSVTIPKWLGIPGVRHSIGLARWWHFSINLLWVLTGVTFYVLLFATDQWRRVVPVSWDVLPNAFSVAVQYGSLHFPAEETWTRYNALQQLTYFFTIFVVAPVQIFTGLMQSPAIANKLGILGRPLNRQLMRSLHFFGLCWFLFFILVHVSLVFMTGARANLNYMFAGLNDESWTGSWIFCAVTAVVILAWYLATPFTLEHARLVQNIGRVVVGPLKAAAETWSPLVQYPPQAISPRLWLNGREPDSTEFKALAEGGFARYQLHVGGLVEQPRAFSYAELQALPKQEQITEHFCIQGWSGVAQWGGVAMRDIMGIVKPTPQARYAVFYSFAEGADGGIYYDVHNMRNMGHELTILAYEMNGAPLPLPHGAPLRLRCENELGFKMVKWIRAIEFVDEYRSLGSGQGGYNEDHEFYGNRMSI
jgi:DMSO/TMAO reductase YedYZ molybdopterin-dependent catalytic subunit/thiosulfate reductase cytochrome b subunit